jgi:hypothetical protein
MSKEIGKIKQQPAEPNFWQEPGTNEQQRQEFKTKTSLPVKSFDEPAVNFSISNPSIHKKEKLTLVDLNGSNRKGMPGQTFLNHDEWNVADGDYKGHAALNYEGVARYRMMKKRMQKIYVALALIIAALIVFGIVSIAASARAL